MNYGTIKSLVNRNLGGRSNIDTYIQEWTNSCYLDLVTRGKFPELQRFAPIPIPELDDTGTFDTTDGAASYAYSEVSSDLLFPISLRDTTNNVSLREKSIRWYDRYKSTTDAKPTRYATYGGKFWLDPTPNGTYTIQVRFRKKVDIPLLVNDSDTPVIGEEWHEAIVLGATYRGARSLNHPDRDTWLRDLKTFMIAHSEQYTEEEEDADIGFSVEL